MIDQPVSVNQWAWKCVFSFGDIYKIDANKKDKKKIVFHGCFTNGLIIRGVDHQEYKDIYNTIRCKSI